MAEDAFEELDLHQSDEESKNPDHSKLLGAVSQLYEKKRVKAPTRKEPSLEVSEFHLSKVDKKNDRVKVTDLAKVLNKRAVHAEISHKLKTAHKTLKTLPKPLEQSDADRINRIAGYENAKQQLNRWDAIVYQQRVAEQLTFPLKSETIKVHEDTDISKMFRKPTELEIQMAAILKSGNNSQKEEEKNEEDYPLTLAEIIERKKMMARLRAQQSYKQAKANRHSKIKSKKFHQIQRRAKVKEQLKDFEELQKKDPEAALKKLEELERTRAEERVTLRHRSTGQWAKNLAVRAKYDKEARIALAEQLSKSKELTVKLAPSRDSESEKEDEEVEVPAQQSAAEEDPDNPWVVKRTKEMEDFVSGYRKYWESEGKDLGKNNISDTALKVTNSTIDVSKSTQKPNNVKRNEHEDQRKAKPAAHNLTQKDAGLHNAATLIDQKENKKNNDKENKSLSKPSSLVAITPIKVSSDFQVSDSVTQKRDNKQIAKNLSSPQVTSLENNNGSCINNFKVEKSKIKQSNKKAANSQNVLPSSSWVVSVVKNTKNHAELKKRKASKDGNQRLNSLGNSFEVTTSKTVKTNNSKLKSVIETKTSNTNIPSPSKVEEDTRNEKSLDMLFEEVEDKIQNRIQERVNRLKETISKKRKNNDQVSVDSEAKDKIPTLELKKQKISAVIDEELIENTGKEGGDIGERDRLSKALNTVSSETKKSNDIDPNKFLKVTPRILSSQLPEMMTEGDDAVDDEENTAEDRHLTISEAFADDDVVDQFQKEKDEEMKKDSVGDVDLTLPGWGSWAGHNMNPVSRRKRKKFVIKFPKVIPRRDANRGNVIINEDADKPIKDHQVSDLPFPFTSVKEYEASIRAPLGSTWVPQTAHKKLTMPHLVTKLGTIIAPMDESQLVKKQTPLPSNNKKTAPPTVKRNKK